MLAEFVEEEFEGNDYSIRICPNGISIVRTTLDPGYVFVEALTKRHSICKRLSTDPSAANVDLVASSYL